MSVQQQTPPLLQRMQRNGGQEEEQGAEGQAARPDQRQGKPEVVKIVSDRGNDDRKVPAHEIHAEQKEGDTSGSNLGVDNLNNDGKRTANQVSAKR